MSKQCFWLAVGVLVVSRGGGRDEGGLCETGSCGCARALRGVSGVRRVEGGFVEGGSFCGGLFD